MCVNTIIAAILSIVLVSFAFVLKFKINNNKDENIKEEIKDNEGGYLRHYLGQKQDITYFSEQLRASDIPEKDRYRITFNPKLWIPEFNFTTASE